MILTSHRGRAVPALLLILVLALAGCGSSNSSSSSSGGSTSSSPAASGADPAIAAMVPSAIASKGSVTVATDASYAPNEYFDTDGTTIIGMDVDLGHAIGKVMGVQWNFENAGFDGIIPGLASGKYDIGMSSFTDTKEREQTVDFVTYSKAGTVLLHQGRRHRDPEPGRRSAATPSASRRGRPSWPTRPRRTRSARTPASRASTIQAFPTRTAPTLALAAGRADVAMADTPVVGLRRQAVERPVRTVRPVLRRRALRHRDPQGHGRWPSRCSAAHEEADRRTARTSQILTKWGVESVAITNPVINGAIS